MANKRQRSLTLGLPEEALTLVEDVDEDSFFHKDVNHEATQALIDSFKQSTSGYVEISRTGSDSAKLVALCNVLHATQGSIDLVSSKSGVHLAESCQGMLNHMGVLEIARNLNNKFI